MTNRSPAKKLYLAGPISGQNYAGATNWRTRVEDELYPFVECLSPMRTKSYLNIGIDDVDNYPLQNVFEKAMSERKGVVSRDRNDVLMCDAVLMNLLDAPKVSIGTMIEVGWADAWRKPIILVIEDGNIHNHPMLMEIAGFIVPTLSMGVQIVRAVLNSED